MPWQPAQPASMAALFAATYLYAVEEREIAYPQRSRCVLPLFVSKSRSENRFVIKKKGQDVCLM